MQKTKVSGMFEEPCDWIVVLQVLLRHQHSGGWLRGVQPRLPRQRLVRLPAIFNRCIGFGFPLTFVLAPS